MDKKPKLQICTNLWCFSKFPYEISDHELDSTLDRIKKGGIDAICWNAQRLSSLKTHLSKHELKFAGAFDCGNKEMMRDVIAAQLELGNGPMNCQLADDDTEYEEALDLTIALMEEAERQGADVHLEMHRDTCTETPEKTYAIIDGYKNATGKDLKVNFDFSHPAIVKHLLPSDYAKRLILRPDLFQKSRLWHMRPFNGHHCQIPITNRDGSFSPEYEHMRPFIRECLSIWLDTATQEDTLWVVPELGPADQLGYGLSCFPPIDEEMFVLAGDIKKIWNEVLDT